jgi:hypothetical protein
MCTKHEQNSTVLNGQTLYCTGRSMDKRAVLTRNRSVFIESNFRVAFLHHIANHFSLLWD